MPSWGVHIATANKLIKKIEKDNVLKNVEKNGFLLGNILPDIKNGYIISADKLSSIVSHNDTHFTDIEKIKDNNEFTDISIKSFLKCYENKLNNSVVLGYFTHLLTDYYWNYKTFSNHYIRNENGETIGAVLINNQKIKCSKKEARLIKHKDFRYFGYYISNIMDVDIPIYNNKITIDAKEIKELKITDDEIKTTISYIADMKKQIEKPLEKYSYRMFNEMELNKIFDECNEYIYSCILKILQNNNGLINNI